ncbi:AAA family ATPase [Burkholderia sp. JPY481]|uniref:AAA family ATPase n=1 Tax=Paraburkholderia sp. JPY465 TaxID=3042285 RepID=UPI003177AFC3
MNNRRWSEADVMRAAEVIEFNENRREQIELGKQRLATANAEAAKATAHAAPLNGRAGAEPPADSVLLQCAADVTPQPVTWLWPDWLPAGKLTILAGASGTGKTTLALDLAAVVSRGGAWPDGTACAHPGQVLIWSSEDDASDTLVPRLMAADADLSRIHLVRNVAKTGGELVPFDPARDMPLLSERMASMGGARLLIVDPVVSAIGGDAHRANDVRRDLQPLVDLAARHGCAVIGISHFAKGSSGKAPVERVIGSQAFGALARMVLVTAKDDGAERRILARAKSNIAADDGGFAYTLERVEVQAGIIGQHIAWGERIDGSARDILGEVEQQDDEAKTEQAEAEALLRGLLADGPVRARELKADADGAGFNWKTMQRAASRLGVETRKLSMKEGWQWALPKRTDSEGDTKETEQNTMSPSGPAVPFGPGVALRSVPLDGSAEGDMPQESGSSEKNDPPDDDDRVQDSV